jgi:hypothetical protein
MVYQIRTILWRYQEIGVAKEHLKDDIEITECNQWGKRYFPGVGQYETMHVVTTSSNNKGRRAIYTNNIKEHKTAYAADGE